MNRWDVVERPSAAGRPGKAAAKAAHVNRCAQAAGRTDRGDERSAVDAASSESSPRAISACVSRARCRLGRAFNASDVVAEACQTKGVSRVVQRRYLMKFRWREGGGAASAANPRARASCVSTQREDACIARLRTARSNADAEAQQLKR